MSRTLALLFLGLFSFFLPDTLPGWIPFWPSIAALIFVVITRKPTSGLAFGALLGCFYLNRYQPGSILPEFISTHLVGSIATSWNVSILLFTLIFGGFAGILQVGGGLAALAHRLTDRDKRHPNRAMEYSAFGLGVVCFFDGLINSLLVGRIFRPLADDKNLPRVRLAYIVDSTSSPIACLALASTWIAYQLAMIREGISGLDPEPSAYSLFLASWPVNFYCLFSLILVAATIYFRSSWGPMERFENVGPPQAGSEGNKAQASEPPPVSGGSSGLRAALISLGFLLTALLTGLLINGQANAPDGSALWVIIGYADAAMVLLLVSLISAAFARWIHVFLAGGKAQPDWEEAFWTGAASMLKPLTVLLAAWALGSTLDSLGTAEALATTLGGELSPTLLPAVVFLCGAVISFFTGTSWGTMGILTPLAVPLALSMGVEADLTLAAWTIGATFSGAVFGDHCSPLSDTTLVSSLACGVDPWDHVRTQLPYALLAGTTACLFGFIPLGLGLPVGLCLLLGVGVCIGVSWWFRGRSLP